MNNAVLVLFVSVPGFLKLSELLIHFCVTLNLNEVFGNEVLCLHMCKETMSAFIFTQ